jgi:hypothetical protein
MIAHEAVSVADDAGLERGVSEEREEENAVEVRVEQVAAVDAAVRNVVERSGFERSLGVAVAWKTGHGATPGAKWPPGRFGSTLILDNKHR